MIGGSIAKAIKKNIKNTTVLAFDKNHKELKKAYREKIIDSYFTKLEAKYFDVDLIIFSLPIHTLPHIVPFIRKWIPSQSLLTDTTSTKESILKIFFKFKNFVGSHPLAGSEKNGYSFSSEKLLYNKICVLTPPRQNHLPILRLKKFWSKLKMKVITLKAKEHDDIVGLTSHFIHVLSFSYIYYLQKNKINLKKIWGPSFQDFTRISKSNPEIWKDIFIDNKNKINIITKKFIHDLNDFQKFFNHPKKLNKVLSQLKGYSLKLNNE